MKQKIKVWFKNYVEAINWPFFILMVVCLNGSTITGDSSMTAKYGLTVSLVFTNLILLSVSVLAYYRYKFVYKKETTSEENKTTRPVRFSLPTNAHCSKKALDDYGSEETEINMEKHKAFIAGSIWMREECVKVFETKDN